MKREATGITRNSLPRPDGTYTVNVYVANEFSFSFISPEKVPVGTAVRFSWETLDS